MVKDVAELVDGAEAEGADLMSKILIVAEHDGAQLNRQHRQVRDLCARPLPVREITVAGVRARRGRGRRAGRAARRRRARPDGRERRRTRIRWPRCWRRRSWRSPDYTHVFGPRPPSART